MKKIILLVITIVYLLLMNTYWQTMSADESYVGSQRALKYSWFERSLTLADKSVLKNPKEPRYFYGRAKVLLATTIDLNAEETMEVKKRALSDLQHAQNLNPINLVTLRNIVPLYYFLAIDDLEKNNAFGNIDEAFFEITKNYYESIKHYSPTDVGIYALLAKYEAKLEMKESAESIENIKRLRPDLLEWYLIL